MTTNNDKNDPALCPETVRVNSMTDEQIEESMRDRWTRGDFERSGWSHDDAEALWRRVEAAVDNSDSSRLSAQTARVRRLRLVRIAAAILLPLVVVSASWLLMTYRHDEPMLTVVETGPGEKATIILPDGSKVKLNYGSRFSYDPAGFKDGDRNVSIDGEAMFSVSKQEGHPFTVKAHNMKVEVLGTRFNLRARSKENKATLLLEQGRVQMTATKSGAETMITPVRKATLDYLTNSIRVSKATTADAATAWMRGELKFDDEPLLHVLTAIEGNYGVRFTDNAAPGMLRDRFSGTLPSADLSEALSILEHTYNIKFNVNDKKIQISRE